MQQLLEIKQLTKRYGQQNALNHVSFHLNQGEICGLVGQNGAGKTTLIRIIAGLIRQTSGEVNLAGDFSMGVTIESPALYPKLSAYHNLAYQAKVLGIKNIEQRVQEVLALVGLSDVDRKKKVKDFSLGMRQRMGIAMAILDTPKFLMLDEPINGLDPSGVKEMRNIIHQLRDEYGMTIIISSHILAELELIADRFVILHQGELIKDITKADLAAAVSKKVRLNTKGNQVALELLTNQGFTAMLTTDGIELPIDTSIQAIIDILANQVEILAIYSQGSSFEDYYLNLIQ